MDRRHELVREALDEWNIIPIRFLEIGIRHGETYDALHDYIRSRGILYTGIDIKFYPWQREIPRPPHICVEIDSVDYWNTLPVGVLFHVIFVDGCHGEVHTEIDLKGALLHLEINGILLMHDTGCSSTFEHPRIKNAGAFGAICRSCRSRSEVISRMDGSHPEGMGIVKKLLPIGKEFLLETETSDINSCWEKCETFSLKPCPKPQEAFPFYF